MQIPAVLLRRFARRRRVSAARVWQEAARRDAAAHSDAVRRILVASHPEYVIGQPLPTGEDQR